MKRACKSVAPTARLRLGSGDDKFRALISMSESESRRSERYSSSVIGLNVSRNTCHHPGAASLLVRGTSFACPREPEEFIDFFFMSDDRESCEAHPIQSKLVVGDNLIRFWRWRIQSRDGRCESQIGRELLNSSILGSVSSPSLCVSVVQITAANNLCEY